MDEGELVPGDTVWWGTSRRVIVDISDEAPPVALLRRTDDDPERRVDDEGTDVDIEWVILSGLERA